MNFFRTVLQDANFKATETPRLRVAPATRFGYVAGPDGEPLRVDSKHTPVVVPTYDWSAQRLDEDVIIAKVLMEAARQVPLKVSTPKALDKIFWIKHNRHMKVFICHPSLHGKFYMPLGPKIYKHEDLPKDQMVCLGSPQFVGSYVRHGNRRGVLIHNKIGLCAIQFFGQ